MLNTFTLTQLLITVLACNPEYPISNTNRPKPLYFEAQNSSYFLFTRQNIDAPQEIIDRNDHSLNWSHFDVCKKTKIIVHGWRGSANSNYNSVIKNAFLKKYDANVIVVDWSYDANEQCERASKTVKDVGKKLATFLDWLTKLGSSPQSFHLVGFSLGAQVAGSAGRQVKNGKIGYLTGLDPSKRFFENTTENININDASYVEIIHTDKNDLGISFPSGHCDFYPNFGESMPGCKNESRCSHSRSYEYFVESILNDDSFVGSRCLNYGEIISKNCSNFCTLKMGGGLAKKKVGVFYLETNPTTPYSVR